MNTIEIIILVVFTIVMSAGIGYYLTKEQPTLRSMQEDTATTPDATQASLTQSAKELIKQVDKVAKVPTTQEESQQLAKDVVNVATSSTKKNKKHYHNNK